MHRAGFGELTRKELAGVYTCSTSRAAAACRSTLSWRRSSTRGGKGKGGGGDDGKEEEEARGAKREEEERRRVDRGAARGARDRRRGHEQLPPGGRGAPHRAFRRFDPRARGHVTKETACDALNDIGNVIDRGGLTRTLISARAYDAEKGTVDYGKFIEELLQNASQATLQPPTVLGARACRQ